MNTGHFTAPLQGARLILGLYPGLRFACPGLLSFGPSGAFFYRAECSFQAYPADAGQAAPNEQYLIEGCGFPPIANKRQRCRFNKTGRHGVLRAPTHRTKTSCPDPEGTPTPKWGTVSSAAGRRSRWGTRRKRWTGHGAFVGRTAWARRRSSPMRVKMLQIFPQDYSCRLWGEGQ